MLVGRLDKEGRMGKGTGGTGENQNGHSEGTCMVGVNSAAMVISIAQIKDVP